MLIPLNDGSERVIFAYVINKDEDTVFLLCGPKKFIPDKRKIFNSIIQDRHAWEMNSEELTQGIYGAFEFKELGGDYFFTDKEWKKYNHLFQNRTHGKYMLETIKEKLDKVLNE